MTRFLCCCSDRWEESWTGINLNRNKPRSRQFGCFQQSTAPSQSTASLAQWLRRPPEERKIPGSNPACTGIFPGSSHTSDLRTGTPAATLPGAWRHGVSAGIGWSGVSILWLGEMESWICNFCLSVAACRTEQICPLDTLPCCWYVKQPTNKPLSLQCPTCLDSPIPPPPPNLSLSHSHTQSFSNMSSFIHIFFNQWHNVSSQVHKDLGLP